MAASTAALVLTAIGAAAAAAVPGRISTAYPPSHVTRQNQHEAIQWGDCDIETGGGFPVRCGTLKVPLDYTDGSSTETVTLELIKWPAAKQPAPKGSILLNFGGPGQDGLESFLVYVPELQLPIIGDQHDIISWDPRGTRNTLPFRCYDDPSTALLTTEWYGSSDTNPGRLWAEGSVLSDLCHERLRHVGSHVGMAAVSRDIISIADALGEDGLVCYWGISGGTALGATLAAMFPDRVDKVILDGVMNSHEYYHQPVETEWHTSSDDVMRGLLAACVQVGEPRCPLAQHGETVDDLEKVVDKLLDDLKYRPFPVASTAVAPGFAVPYSEVMVWLYMGLYRPTEYPNISIALDALVRKDAATFVQYAYGADLGTIVASRTAAGSAAATLNGTLVAPPTAVYGIRCGDKVPRAESLEALDPSIQEIKSKTRWFSGFGIRQNAILCAQWRFEAKERYLGDFHVKTRNPILWIGNTHDPATPLASAKNMSSGFAGSVVLEHGGYGHVSFVRGGESNCTIKAIQDYLDEGILPKPGTKCETNRKLADLF